MLLKYATSPKYNKKYNHTAKYMYLSIEEKICQWGEIIQFVWTCWSEANKDLWIQFTMTYFSMFSFFCCPSDLCYCLLKYCIVTVVEISTHEIDRLSTNNQSKSMKSLPKLSVVEIHHTSHFGSTLTCHTYRRCAHSLFSGAIRDFRWYYERAHFWFKVVSIIGLNCHLKTAQLSDRLHFLPCWI